MTSYKTLVFTVGAALIGVTTLRPCSAQGIETYTENADGTRKQPLVIEIDKMPQHHPQTLWHIERSLSWMQPKAQVQAAIFAHIEKKVGHKIVVPTFPLDSPDSVIDWYHERWMEFTQREDEQAYADAHPNEIYKRHAEDLLVAQQMLQSSDF